MSRTLEASATFPWLPLGTPLAHGALGKLLLQGPGWQVCATDHASQVVVLFAPSAPDQEWREAELAALEESLALAPGPEGSTLRYALFPADHRPTTVGEMIWRNRNIDDQELAMVTHALSGLRQRMATATWSSALILPTLEMAMASESAVEEDRRSLLLALMSGGAGGPRLTPARVTAFNPRLTSAQVTAALETLGALSTGGAAKGAREVGSFTLPGHPKLEALLRERVIDVLNHRERYEALKVRPPNGLLFAGPTGCGKSFAAERLARFLGWPVHEVSLMEVGSKWLHETSGRLVAAFDAAAAEAPAMILLEEVDAIGASRARDRVALDEEVNALLRLVERAGDRGLLVVATTNRLEAVDPALRRAGRFDLVAVMDYPDGADAEAMLLALLAERPHAPGLDVLGLARRLARRPASDLAWVVNEAARLTARAGTERIDALTLARAAGELLGR